MIPFLFLEDGICSSPMTRMLIAIERAANHRVGIAAAATEKN